jgi:hypothetical protein
MKQVFLLVSCQSVLRIKKISPNAECIPWRENPQSNLLVRRNLRFHLSMKAFTFQECVWKEQQLRILRPGEDRVPPLSKGEALVLAHLQKLLGGLDFSNF